MTDRSGLTEAVDALVQRSARGMVARARLAAPGLNRHLLRRLTAPQVLVPDPIIEVARSWLPASRCLGELAGNLLSPDLVDALDRAGPQAQPRDRHPHAHQLEAWQESLVGNRSVLVTAGTGAGKTECFLIPILQDILARARPGGGVQAILLYPLNALIESQRERLAAWAEGLGGRVRFALWNGDTARTEREAASTRMELRSREAVRRRPPEILVTNTVMLEYLLLRGDDAPILAASQGGLRWIVLDEAHSYVGSQAAEMALLLRRVRAAFGVAPADVRLMATSATIGGEPDAPARLRSFCAALAGRPEADVAVVEGRERQPDLPPAGPDTALDPAALLATDRAQAGAVLAAHPRVQRLRRALNDGGLPLSAVADMLTGAASRAGAAVALLDAASQATWQGRPLLPWRAHLFHRAQGGLWACPDPACPHRGEDLAAPEAGWPFGAAWLSARARCDCDAPLYEVVGCTECGQVHLQGLLTGGRLPRLDPPDPGEGDDFALDAEPDEDDTPAGPAGNGWLAPGTGILLTADGRIYDNAAPEGQRAWPYRLIEDAALRGCCDRAEKARLMGLRFGPNFLMGNALGGVLQDLVMPDGRPGLPAGGRRALTFTDSRQGVARLAAKFQQDAERSLTRAFLWHKVQAGTQADEGEVAELRRNIARLEGAGLDDLAGNARQRLASLTGAVAAPIPWSDLVAGLAAHADLTGFAGDIWKGRRLGQAIGDDPARLAQTFLYRELFRRPRVQNNPETMGLLRLTSPGLEERARRNAVPRPLAEAGVDIDGWLGLVQAAVDGVFRNNFAIYLPFHGLARLINPRQPGVRSVYAQKTKPSEYRTDTDFSLNWPSPSPNRGRQSRILQSVYALIGGDPDSPADQDRAAEVLEALWTLITGTGTARDTGAGAFALDFARAAVTRLDRAWLCPVTRRPYGYAVAGRSPNDPARMMETVDLPRLPVANPGGLSAHDRSRAVAWAETDPAVRALRARGLWTDLHDRLAAFPPYLRAQEHSAQISRRTLQRYEEQFRDGRINLLNCSTTMEMGVDLADVRLVVNANVPPALSNYRQRAGRAGRRGEPWAFTLTFCRDLPLDRKAADSPGDYLRRQIVAPRVWLDSPTLVQRHVNAALLAAWLRERGGHRLASSIGAFLGAGESLADAVVPDAPADLLLADLAGAWGAGQGAGLAPLVAGTALADAQAEALVARTMSALDAVVVAWRREHRVLLDGAANASDRDAATAMALRARRLAGEFMLSEVARRGFTPAYGFPTDVVTFDNLSEHVEAERQTPGFRRQGTASRTLDQAIREYAPGAEVVIDGLVHMSEGILPAWEAGVDASRLEDLRTLWTCPACRAFGLTTMAPDHCTACAHPAPDITRVLRPAGFIGAKPAHVGYEYIAHVQADPVRLSAQGGEWLALPDGAGRMRADPAGQIVTSTSGPGLGGFAVCLDCGRAEPMAAARMNLAEPLPKAIMRHGPLFRGRGLKLTHDGLCPATDAPQRIQRHVHLAQLTRSDVWEWQLPAGVAEPAAHALAAALREGLSVRLGVEADEMVASAGPSTGPAGASLVSAYLHDRAAGGAGLVARLAEPDLLSDVLAAATGLLDCVEQCRRGCPACILRSNLNRRDSTLDRPGAHRLALSLRENLDLAAPMRVFGPESRLAGQPAAARLANRLRAGGLDGVDIWLHGDPAAWDLGAWPVRALLPRLAEAGVRPRLHLARSALTAAGLDLARKLGLHAVAQWTELYRCDALPVAGEAPIVMCLHHAGGTEALAVAAPAEAVPTADWAAGRLAPLIAGPGPGIPLGARLSVDRLLERGTGNAHLLWPGSALDGPAAGFGRRFWSWLGAKAPLEIGAMQEHGVMSLTYSDRYLLQAYTLRLLAEVMQAAPGSARAAWAVRLAPADRPAIDPRSAHDGFADDTDRVAVLRALLPGADIASLPKAALPHHRALTAVLADGRRLSLLLDQGFGSWRVEGVVRHAFGSPPTAQARSLREADIRVLGTTTSGAPVALTIEKDVQDG